MPLTQQQKPVRAKAKPLKALANDLLVQVPPSVRNTPKPVRPSVPHRFPVHIDRTVPPHEYQNSLLQFFVENGASLSRALPQFQNQYLRPNSCFVGEQQSGTLRYEIKVQFKSVDLASSEVTGFFEISGLTDDHPVITTCFRGEIINNPLADSSTRKYSFATENPEWGLFLENDLEHWRKLTGVGSAMLELDFMRRLARIHAGRADPLHVYMRWKEEFLLPDLRVKTLKNALFEGFYYVVLNVGQRADAYCSLIPGSINGLYFHTQNEKFQSLVLRHVETRGPGATYDFA